MKRRIMVVDDDDGIRYLVKTTLEMEGYEVTEASNIVGLRQALAGQSPDAVVLDLKLPDGSGLELLPELKEKWPASKVIILTGYGTVEVAEEAYKQIEDVYVQSKPFDSGTLKALLELALMGNSKP